MSWLTANERGGALPASWYAEATPPDPAAPPLAGDLRVETCVIGAGFTGLSAALHLARAGRSVALLEAHRVGWGASGRNGGQISAGFNRGFDALAARLGPARARALWALSADAVTLARALIAAHAPEADFRAGLLHVDDRPGALAALRADVEQPEAGLAGLEFLPREAVAAAVGSARFVGGVLDRSGGYCQPFALARGLGRAARAAGARLFEASRVRRISEGFALETAGGTVRADRVILAVNGYHDGLSGAVADRVLPINNYIAVTEPLGERAPMAAPWAVADGRFVVNYWWQSRDGRLVYGGGESYGRRFPRDIGARVRANLTRVYPALRGVRLSHAWGGTLAVTATRLPYVGEPAPGLMAAGGYSGHGVALSLMAGRAMAEAVAGDRGRLALLEALPVPRLPGGRLFGPALAQAGMAAAALSDRLRH